MNNTTTFADYDRNLRPANGYIVSAETHSRIRPATFAELITGYRAAIEKCGNTLNALGIFTDTETTQSVYVEGEIPGTAERALNRVTFG